MLTIHNQGMYYKNGSFIPAQDGAAAGLPAPEEARKGTMARDRILSCWSSRLDSGKGLRAFRRPRCSL